MGRFSTLQYPLQVPSVTASSSSFIGFLMKRFIAVSRNSETNETGGCFATFLLVSHTFCEIFRDTLYETVAKQQNTVHFAKQAK
jgi:hypothetical protein